MRIGLLSDSHGFLDEAIFTYFKECDEVWHAGDFGDVELLDALKKFKPVRGVYGNIDGAEIRAELPLEIGWECEGLPVYMIHIGGYPGGMSEASSRSWRRFDPSFSSPGILTFCA